ncbi:hypothetical protein HK097_006330 [Rhizophlyctis rosea]|uniref:Uncharacterized protein n=1 Tax=Rhizophlyctis rosea TaxID=64517 RepID=A0AAD5X567_9FUNG|nr:hypothetical protein HK097_006330 [Rhizophlyctis rosea]
MPAFHPFHIGLALAAPASTAVYLGGTYAFSAVIFPVLHDRRITAETAHDTLKVILDHGPKTLAPVALIAAGLSAVATYYIPASARTAYAIGTAALGAIGAWTTWAILPLHTRVSILGKEEIRAHYLGTLASRYQVRTLLAAVALGSQLYGFWTSRWIIV